MKYKTSLDKTAKIITLCITSFFAFMIVVQLSLSKSIGLIIPLLTTIILLGAYMWAFIFRSISYLLSDSKLIIHRLYNDVKIDMSNISSAEILDNKKIGTAMRNFGVDGFFGYFGKYSISKIGNVTYYATRKDTMVLIKTKDDKKIILTPNEPDEFITNLHL